jgi:hypothetical protein
LFVQSSLCAALNQQKITVLSRLNSFDIMPAQSVLA